MTHLIKRLFLISLLFNHVCLWAVGSGVFVWPDLKHLQLAGAPSFGTMTLDASGEACSFIFPIPKSGNIIKCFWRTGTVTTGATTNVSFYNVFSSGIPNTESLYHANATVSQVIDNGQDNMMQISTFTSFPVVAGDTIAWVVTNPIASPGTMQINFYADDGVNLPYAVTNLGSGWSKAANGLVFALQYDDNSFAYINGAWPIKDVPTTSFNQTSTLNERGVWLIPQWSGRVVGFQTYNNFQADTIVSLYGEDGVTRLSSTTIMANTRVSANGMHYDYFPPVDLPGGKKYRLALEPINGATNITFNEINVASATAREATPGGLNWGSTYAKDATGNASWVDLTTMTAIIGLVYDRIYNGASSMSAK